MLAPAKLWSLTATEVQNLTRRDEITAEQYATALLNRINSRDGVVKAWKFLGVPPQVPPNPKIS